MEILQEELNTEDIVIQAHLNSNAKRKVFPCYASYLTNPFTGIQEILLILHMPE